MTLSELIIKKIYAVNLINFSYPVLKQRTDRRNGAIAFKLEGRTVYEFSGKKYISDADHILIIPPYVPYSFQIEKIGACVEIELESDSYTEPCSFEIKNGVEINNLVRKILLTWNTAPNGYQAKVFSDTYRLLYLAAEKSASSDYAYESKSKMIYPAISYIKNHYADGRISGKYLAELCNISEVYFRKIFTAALGVSPQRYIIDLRMKKAKEILIGDYSSVEDVASAVGYSNIYNFCKAFKNEVGVSPTGYAKGER